MATLKLDVPTLAQELSDCCWNTSAMMIWMYWQSQSGRQGPMNTLIRTYERNHGITPQEFITLARTIGLEPLPNKSLHSSGDLHWDLKSKGPLWCAGHWFGPGHVIVLTGIDGGQVFFNDPDGGVKKSATVDWFNKKLASSLHGSLMFKDPGRY